MSNRALVALAIAALLANGCAGQAGSQHRVNGRSAQAGTSKPSAGRWTLIGRSRQGRPLYAWSAGAVRARRRLLVVGVVHGNESAGLAMAMSLVRLAPSAASAVMVVPDANPDGLQAHSRQNAAGVDLNRNFPFRWTRLGRPGDQQYSGPGPLSEPESRAMVRLIRAFRPTVSIWFHQPVGVVDESGGSSAIESRFAAVSGLPLRRLSRYPGSAVGWENATFPRTTSFVVELPAKVGAGLRRSTTTALRSVW